MNTFSKITKRISESKQQESTHYNQIKRNAIKPEKTHISTFKHFDAKITYTRAGTKIVQVRVLKLQITNSGQKYGALKLLK